MWLEIKAAFTIVGIFIIGLNFLTHPFDFLLKIVIFFVGIMILIVGEAIFGIKMINTDAINILDTTAPGETVVAAEQVGGGYRFLKAKIGMLGKLEFRLSKNKAGIVDDGKAPKRLPNGSPMVLAHVLYDRNINPVKAKFLEEESKNLKIKDVKELYEAYQKEEKQNA